MDVSRIEAIRVLNGEIKEVSKRLEVQEDIWLKGLPFTPDRKPWDEKPFDLCDIWALSNLKKELMSRRDEAPLVIIEEFRNDLYMFYLINEAWMHGYQAIDEYISKLTK